MRKDSTTFGGINLEDIKAPECFIVEEKLKAMLDIPVFHDDQHGTAIIRGRASQCSRDIGQEDRGSEACCLWCRCCSNILYQALYQLVSEGEYYYGDSKE